ncbi:MAG: hypothetical protein IJA66_03310 [Alistipes sp.]|nr:hypothetical protein [Alistipes sp.]
MNSFIHKADDLVTSHEQTRAGFIETALEKNRKAQPYIEAARTLKSMASDVGTPINLLGREDIMPSLLTASGLSDKALQYFTEADKIFAVRQLIEQFLDPAGKYWVDELVYRFLLIRGASLDGSIRNHIGTMAKIKVIRKVLSVLQTMGISYSVLTKDNKTRNRWDGLKYTDDFENAENICAISWQYGDIDKILFFDSKIPIVNKNIDICLYKGGTATYDAGRIVNKPEKAIMFGELKGGIDPAGADEHWKTANTALERIRMAFKNNIKTSFVGAAIERNMADEIWAQLSTRILNNAANLTIETQFTDYCKWIVTLE